MRVEYLASNDPFENAAFEERIYRGQRLGGEATLLFYTNRESVLLGRNQEPSRECDLAWCESEGVPVLRRVSGGGTVWHDLGNQNYAFIMPRRSYDPERILSIVVDALRLVGVKDAFFCRRFSVWHGDNKISGSAFALSGQGALLHGCLPFTSDLARLQRALVKDAAGDDPAVPRSRIASVVSPVENIAPLCTSPERCRNDFCQALATMAATIPLV